jgi:hypothetical protein
MAFIRDVTVPVGIVVKQKFCRRECKIQAHVRGYFNIAVATSGTILARRDRIKIVEVNDWSELSL